MDGGGGGEAKCVCERERESEMRGKGRKVCVCVRARERASEWVKGEERKAAVAALHHHCIATTAERRSSSPSTSFISLSLSLTLMTTHLSIFTHTGSRPAATEPDKKSSQWHYPSPLDVCPACLQDSRTLSACENLSFNDPRMRLLPSDVPFDWTALTFFAEEAFSAGTQELLGILGLFSSPRFYPFTGIRRVPVDGSFYLFF